MTTFILECALAVTIRPSRIVVQSTNLLFLEEVPCSKLRLDSSPAFIAIH